MAHVEQDSSDLTPKDLAFFQAAREAELRYWKIRALAYDLAEMCETFDDFVRADHALDLEYRRRNKEPDGHLYVLRAGPYYKIGRTVDLSSRITQLRIQLPFPVEVLYTFECEHMVDAETYFHSRFARKRRNGEWFELDAMDLREFERFKGRGILYLASADLFPEAREPRTRPEWEEPFVDEVTEKILRPK